MHKYTAVDAARAGDCGPSSHAQLGHVVRDTVWPTSNSSHIPGLFSFGLAPRYARLTLALRPSITGLGSSIALSAPSLSVIVTCAQEQEIAWYRSGSVVIHELELEATVRV